jgi:hypothetical protein
MLSETIGVSIDSRYPSRGNECVSWYVVSGSTMPILPVTWSERNIVHSVKREITSEQRGATPANADMGDSHISGAGAEQSNGKVFKLSTITGNQLKEFYGKAGGGDKGVHRRQ